MYYAIHQTEEARGVYETWAEVVPKVLKVCNSRYKKFGTECDAKYWSKHGTSPYMSHISRVEWNGQWSERALDPLAMRGHV